MRWVTLNSSEMRGPAFMWKSLRIFYTIWKNVWLQLEKVELKIVYTLFEPCSHTHTHTDCISWYDEQKVTIVIVESPLSFTSIDTKTQSVNMIIQMIRSNGKKVIKPSAALPNCSKNFFRRWIQKNFGTQQKTRERERDEKMHAGPFELRSRTRKQIYHIVMLQPKHIRIEFFILFFVAAKFSYPFRKNQPTKQNRGDNINGIENGAFQLAKHMHQLNKWSS